MNKYIKIKDFINENKMEFISKVALRFHLQDGDNIKFSQEYDGVMYAFINCEIIFNHSLGAWKMLKDNNYIQLGFYSRCVDFDTNYAEFTFKIGLEEK